MAQIPNPIEVEAGNQYCNVLQLSGPVAPPSVPPVDPIALILCGHNVYFFIIPGSPPSSNVLGWRPLTSPDDERDGILLQSSAFLSPTPLQWLENLTGPLYLWRVSSSVDAVVNLFVWVTPSTQSEVRALREVRIIRG